MEAPVLNVRLVARAELMAALDASEEDYERCRMLRVRLAAVDSCAPFGLAQAAPNLAVLLYGYASEASQEAALDEFRRLAPDLFGE